MKKRIALVTSIAGILGIAMYEGFTDVAVQPLPGDKWTVGFGHTGDVYEGDTVSLREALGLLVKDVSDAEESVNRCVTVALEQYEFDALVSLAYNIGTHAFCRSTLVSRLNEGDMAGVASEWMKWKYFRGKPVKGLENRRARELAVFRGESVKDNGNTVCFGSAGCISSSDLLQDRIREPDDATDKGES